MIITVFYLSTNVQVFSPEEAEKTEVRTIIKIFYFRLTSLIRM